jgi:hypothetical protein
MENQQILPKAEFWLQQWRKVTARAGKIMKDYNTMKDTVLEELLWKALRTAVCEEDVIM